MSITVKEILTLPVFQHARLVAGKDGEIRQVRWATILEYLDEDKQIETEELLLTTAFELSPNSEIKNSLIKSLSDKGLSGIVIQTGYYLEEIPEEIRAEGDAHSFPIIEIQRNVSFSEVTRQVHKYILNKQFEKIQFSEELYKTFTDIALKNEGIQPIASVVGNLINGRINITDTNMNILCDIGNNAATIALSQEQVLEQLYLLREDFDSGALLMKTFDFGHYHLFVAPVKAKDHVYGYISAIKAEKFNEFEEIAIHHTSTMCALEFLKLSSLEEKDRKLKADFLELLLTGNDQDDFTVYSKGEALGYQIGTHDTCVAIICIDHFNKLNQWEKIEAGLQQTILKLLQGYGLQTLFKLFSGQFVMLITNPFTSRVDISEALNKISLYIQNKYSLTLSIGIGNYYKNYNEFKNSYKEAQEALFIIQSVWKKEKTLHYKDLGVYRLLLPLFQQPDIMEEYHKQVLGELAKNEELMETLQVYLENIQKINDVADKLFIHRHTLKYRLKKIEEITNKRLLHFQERIELELALIIYRMLRSE